MTRIIIEQDHFLKVMPVILDPATPPEHCRAVADFYAHDEPDFPGWCARLQARIPGLYPATIDFAEDQADLRAKIIDADGVIIESLAVGAAELQAAGRLAFVQRFGGLVANIDVAACLARRVVVELQPRRVNVAVAEQAFLLIIALAKRLGELNKRVTAADLAADGRPFRPYDTRYSGASNFGRIRGLQTLDGATVGIIGMGEVGRALATRCAAFGMRVLYTQRNRIPAGDEFPSRASYAALPDLLTRSDYVSLNLPLNAGTTGFLGPRELEHIKPGAILVNVARAHLVDRAALLQALRSGRLGGLGLDTNYEEPARTDDELLGFPNVLIMPHTAIAARQNALADLEEMCLKMWHALLHHPGRPTA